eukprot:gene29874-biopygen11610
MCELMALRKDMFPCLIAVPRMVLSEWPPTVRAVTGVFPTLIVDGGFFVSNPTSFLADRKVVITTHGVLRNHYLKFGDVTWGRFVVDEAHVMRNKGTALYRACVHVASQSSIRWAVTATPVHNRDKDVLCLARFVGVHAQDVAILRDALVMHHHVVVPLVVEQPAKEDAVADVNSDIEVRLVTLDVISRAHYDKLKEDYSASSCTSKELDIVATACSSTGVVVFCNWIMEMDLLEAFIGARFREDEVCVSRLDGACSIDERDSTLYRCRTDRETTRVHMLVCQIECANCGLNMQHAFNNVIMMRPQWNPVTNTRRIRRVSPSLDKSVLTGHLIGSADRQDVFKKCTENNLDDRKKYEVSNVKYDDAKLSRSQMQSIIKWALYKWKTEGAVDFNLKTYDGMKTLEEELLCRFLRPSELIRLMSMMGTSIFIRKVTVPIKPTISAGDIVGHLGAHAYALTKKFDLLYVWYHSEDNKLVMYAVEHGYKGGEGKGKIERAIKFLEATQKAYNSHAAKQNGHDKCMNAAIQTRDKCPKCDEPFSSADAMTSDDDLPHRANTDGKDDDAHEADLVPQEEDIRRL